LFDAGWKAPGALPMVFTVDPDPVGRGLVASLARPGGNITGLSDAHADLVSKRLALLKEAVPSAVRVGVLFNPASALGPPQLKTAQAAVPALGMTVSQWRSEAGIGTISTGPLRRWGRSASRGFWSLAIRRSPFTEAG